MYLWVCYSFKASESKVGDNGFIIFVFPEYNKVGIFKP